MCDLAFTSDNSFFIGYLQNNISYLHVGTITLPRIILETSLVFDFLVRKVYTRHVKCIYLYCKYKLFFKHELNELDWYCC